MSDQPSSGSQHDLSGSIIYKTAIGDNASVTNIENKIQQPKLERQCPKPPAKPSEFGGRDEQLKTLKARLKAGQTTAITAAVQGLGGIGKTTLARMLAHELHADKTFRAVLWANVTRNPSAPGIIRDWVIKHADSAYSAVEFSDPAALAADAKRRLEDVINELCEDCDPPRVLIVLDDVWRNGLDAARLLQAACPFTDHDQATILITTRDESVANRLNAGEVERLNRMTEAEAVDLLQQYLPGLPDEGLARLARSLAGHPLAMKLAAGRIKDEAGDSSLAQALAECTAEYEQGIPAGTPFADLELAEGETREESLEVALALSYAELDENEQGYFRALGVLAFDEPFDKLILEALWTIEDPALKKVIKRLRLLSLIESDSPEDDTQTATGWYRQHPLLRAYARALLNDAGESSTTFDRYAGFMTQLAGLFVNRPPEEWKSVNDYLPHLRSYDVASVFVEHKVTAMYELAMYELDVLLPDDARLLLAEIAPGLPNDVVEQLIVGLDGHAQALTIAGFTLQRKAHHGAEVLREDSQTILERVRDGVGFGDLAQVKADLRKRIQKFESVLQYSYDHLASGLDADYRPYFRALGTLAEGADFSADAFAALCQVDDAPHILDELRGFGLVKPLPAGANTPFCGPMPWACKPQTSA